jgi:hypothetical protein
MSPESTAPLSTSALESWPEFAAIVRRRLDVGAREYGDASFTRPPSELSGEIEQELLDVVGWGFVLWCRMQALRARLNVAPDVDEERRVEGLKQLKAEIQTIRWFVQEGRPLPEGYDWTELAGWVVGQIRQAQTGGQS